MGASVCPSGGAPSLEVAGRRTRYAQGMNWLWVIVAVLVLLWFLGLVLRAFGGLIHLLIIVALVIVIFRLLTGRRVL